MQLRNPHTRNLAALAILALAIAPQSPAQTRPQVEVAAIHPSAPGLGDRGFIHIAPGKFEAHNMTVRKLISIAYKFKAGDVLGGPAWLNTETYDITATAADMAGDNFPLTLQTLLEDRFRVKVHRETKEGNVYDLTVAKSGLKMQATPSDSCVPFTLSKDRPVIPADQKTCGWQRSRPGLRTGIGITLADPPGVPLQGLAGQLSTIVDKPVINRTGLAGSFDIHLQWTPEDANPAAPGDPTQPTILPETGPTIFTALREQLGLELKPAKGPITVLIIDTVDHPSEN
jgi:uncharacterized protein (TIGR03435 family)